MADPTEAEKTAAAEKEAADKAAADKAAAASGGEDDKVGLRAALAKQAGEKDAEIAKLNKQVNDNAAASLKAKEDKLKADNKLQELLDTRDKTISDMTDESTAALRSLLESSAREKLRDLGMERPLSLAGAVAGLPADATAETLDAWVAQMKVANEGEFVKGVKALNMGGVGDPAINAGSANWKDVEAQMQSDDPKERKKARELMTAYYQEHGKFPD